MAEHAPHLYSLPPRHPAPAAERSRTDFMRDFAAGGSADLLRSALAREGDLLKQRDDLVQQHQSLRREADHRLVNSLQMVVSMLSLQSRGAATPAITEQLTVAAQRVAAIERVHRRLHKLDGRTAVEFGSYLVDLCLNVDPVPVMRVDDDVAVAGRTVIGRIVGRGLDRHPHAGDDECVPLREGERGRVLDTDGAAPVSEYCIAVRSDAERGKRAARQVEVVEVLVEVCDRADSRVV